MFVELLIWGVRGDRFVRVKIFLLFLEFFCLIFCNLMLNFLFVVDVLLFNSVKFFIVVFGLFENNVVSDLLIVFVGENFVDFFVEVFK